MENPWVSHFFAHAIHLCRSPEAAWTQEPAEAGHLLGWLQESLGRCFFLYKSSHVPAFTRRVLKWTSLTVSIKLDYLYRVMQ